MLIYKGTSLQTKITLTGMLLTWDRINYNNSQTIQFKYKKHGLHVHSFTTDENTNLGPLETMMISIKTLYNNNIIA